jgi:hypothetical protein
VRLGADLVTFAEVLEAEILQAEEDLLWRFTLDLNEVVWGSAYGPWLRPTLVGLAVFVQPAE